MMKAIAPIELREGLTSVSSTRRSMESGYQDGRGVLEGAQIPTCSASTLHPGAKKPSVTCVGNPLGKRSAEIVSIFVRYVGVS
jgi:hypothetical protein